MQYTAASQCKGSGRPVEMPTQLGREYVGKCCECTHLVVCAATGEARAHDRDDVLTLF